MPVGGPTGVVRPHVSQFEWNAIIASYGGEAFWSYEEEK